MSQTESVTLGLLSRTEGGALPVAWALSIISRRTGLSVSERTVLLTVAALAARDLCAPDGYNGIKAGEVANFLGWKQDRARSALLKLGVSQNLLDITNVQGDEFIYRLPETVFDGPVNF